MSDGGTLDWSPPHPEGHYGIKCVCNKPLNWPVSYFIPRDPAVDRIVQLLEDIRDELQTIRKDAWKFGR